MGSKSRYAKYLLPIILKNRKKWYYEPFVGGCNVIDKVEGLRVGVDVNYYLIQMWKALQEGWIPPQSVTNEEYIEIRDNQDSYPPNLVGYVAINLSYAGKWWGGYARDKQNKRDYGREAYNNVMKQVPLIKGILFEHGHYFNFIPNEPATIYCDPPYNGVTEYKNKFEHEIFWEWCRDRAIEGNDIFISEYNAPDDFECIWEKEVNNTLVQNTGAKQGTEKLFIYRG